MILGVTGKYGVGKSEVAREFASKMGAVFVDADKLVHEMYVSGAKGAELIEDNFGKAFLKGDGSVDREKLGDLVFNDELSRKKLNGLIHPLVLQRVNEILADGGDFVIEAFDFGVLADLVDTTVLVRADRQKVLDNVRERGVDGERLFRIWAVQGEVGEFDFLIENDGDLSDLKKKVKVVDLNKGRFIP